MWSYPSSSFTRGQWRHQTEAESCAKTQPGWLNLRVEPLDSKVLSLDQLRNIFILTTRTTLLAMLSPKCKRREWEIKRITFLAAIDFDPWDWIFLFLFGLEAQYQYSARAAATANGEPILMTLMPKLLWRNRSESIACSVAYNPMRQVSAVGKPEMDTWWRFSRNLARGSKSKLYSHFILLK